MGFLLGLLLVVHKLLRRGEDRLDGRRQSRRAAGGGAKAGGQRLRSAQAPTLSIRLPPVVFLLTDTEPAWKRQMAEPLFHMM